MRNQKKYSCCLQPYYDITYALVLKRKTLFYTVHLIIPCVGISLLTFVVFYLPSQSGEKIVLSISIELALTVIFPLLADLIPSTSIMMPLLGKYVLFIMILVALSLFNTIIILAIYYREQNQATTMPKWIRYVFTQALPPVLFLSSRQRESSSVEQSVNSKELLTLPRDHSFDATFARMLEKLLSLGEIEEIFSRFHTAMQHDQVTLRYRSILFPDLLLSSHRMPVIGIEWHSSSIECCSLFLLWYHLAGTHRHLGTTNCK